MTNQLTQYEFHQSQALWGRKAAKTSGFIQNFAALVAFEPGTGEISYVSENVFEILNKTPGDLLGARFSRILGSKLWHAVNNARALPGFEKMRQRVGQFVLMARPVEIHAFRGGGQIVVEFEAEQAPDEMPLDPMATLSFFIDEIQSAESERGLLEKTCDLLRSLSRFDRVAAHKFDVDFNGSLLAESKLHTMPTLETAHLTECDMPKPGRNITRVGPLRIISDVDQPHTPILSRTSCARALDINFADVRGAPRQQLENLRKMGLKSGMTVAIFIDGRPWGMISLHSKRCCVPSINFRRILLTFLPFLCAQVLIKQAAGLLEACDRK